jgi:hypothetical protein
MQLLPWFREEFYSLLPPAELLRRMQAVTAPTPTSDAPITRPGAIFQGWVKADSFRIGRISKRTNRQNSPFTAIEGTVVATATGSRLRLLHRPVLFALVALGFWLTFVGTFVLVSLLMWLRGQSGEYASWGPATVFVAIIAAFVALFWWDVYSSHQLLVPLLLLKRVSPA